MCSWVTVYIVDCYPATQLRIGSEGNVKHVWTIVETHLYFILPTNYNKEHLSLHELNQRSV